MKYKYNEAGNIELDGDKLPIVVYDDGTEKGFDASQAMQKIGELNAESKSHREAKEAEARKLQELAEKYKDIDPEKAAEAIEKIKNLGDGELLKTDQVAELKAKARREAVDIYESKITDMKKHFDSEQGKLESERDNLIDEIFRKGLEGSLADSISNGVLGKKTSISNIKLANGYFGPQFRMEEANGQRRIVAYHWDSDRQIISTGQNAGEPANIEEALSVLFETDPMKSGIEKDVAGGSGATGGTGGSSKTGELSEKEFMESVFK